MSRVALVTGAARRIGRAIALDLARAGWTVGVHYRRSGDAAAEVVERAGRARAFQADLSVESETAALMTRVFDALGPVELLVHNASTFVRDDIATATRETWDLHMEVNLRAPFVLTQQLARLLPEDRQGCIVHLLDQKVWRPTDDFMTYTVSKAGLWMLTRSLALALGPRIRVNAIGPGAALPNSRQDPEAFAALAAATPLGRGTTPAEICAAVRFLVEAHSMTGQMLALDGGQHLWWAPPHPETPRE